MSRGDRTLARALEKLGASRCVIVHLDDARYGAGPGTVVGHADSVASYLAAVTDRDGARNPRARLWAGDYPVGTRVTMRDLEGRLMDGES